jgi:ATP-dependent HslUV protease ATP-binding subunit HslU
VKVEATKFTEVGYVGRDVESMVRDLVEVAIGLVKRRKEDAEKRGRTREKFREMLLAGELEERVVELSVEQKSAPVQVFSSMGMENMDVDLQSMFDRLIPKSNAPRQLPIKDARKVLLEQETEALIDRAAVSEQAIELVENHGMIFLDEIDKVCGPQQSSGPDVSRQGVQRDLLPIVEGTTVNTKHGPVKTDHVLFIAAGAFHASKPSDLMPELQGRFPIRVELIDLSRDDFLRILTEPEHALTKQYAELLRTEGIELEFTREGIEALADVAYELNRTTQNIGARRLHTILERVVEDISFEGPDLAEKKVLVDGAIVREKIGAITKKEDLSKYML